MGPPAWPAACPHSWRDVGVPQQAAGTHPGERRKVLGPAPAAAGSGTLPQAAAPRGAVPERRDSWARCWGAPGMAADPLQRLGYHAGVRCGGCTEPQAQHRGAAGGRSSPGDSPTPLLHGPPPSHPLRATGHIKVLCVGTQLPATLRPAGHAVPLGHRAVPAPRPQAVPTSKVSPVIPRMGKCHPATMSCHPSGAELGTPLGARCHFASPGPPGRREPAARGSQSQVTKVSLLAGWGWGRALTCPMHPRVAVGRGWPLGTAVVGDGDKGTATRSGHRGHSSRALGHCPGTLPPSWGHSHLLGDTATFHGALPPSWGHCHFHEDTDLSGNTATFPVMSQPS